MEMFVEYVGGRGERLPPSLRLVFLSGDWIPVTLPDQIKALGDRAQAISLGGATEASIWSILYPIEHVDPSWKSIPYGRPMANQSFHVLDESLAPCPVWVPGQLYIGGIGLAKGYWHDEEKSNAKFIAHPRCGDRLYCTGDLGRYLPNGDIEFLGREDFQVKVRGYRIELGEIEAAFRQHPRVRSVVVTARGKATAERRLVAYVVSNGGGPTRPTAQLGFESELRDFLAGKLPDYMIPASIVLLDTFPLSSNGKVDYKALPEPEANDLNRRVGHVAPRNRTEEALAKVWQEVLRVDNVGIHDNFFELGGDSVSAIRLITRAHEAGQAITPNQVFLYPTIAELATVIGAEPYPEAERIEAAHRAAEDRRVARGYSMENRQEIEI
jgi:pyochelin synthetase